MWILSTCRHTYWWHALKHLAAHICISPMGTEYLPTHTLMTRTRNTLQQTVYLPNTFWALSYTHIDNMHKKHLAAHIHISFMGSEHLLTHTLMTRTRNTRQHTYRCISHIGSGHFLTHKLVTCTLNTLQHTCISAKCILSSSSLTLMADTLLCNMLQHAATCCNALPHSTFRHNFWWQAPCSVSPADL